MKTFYPTYNNKIQHIMDKVNTETGLSPLQEKAVGLIVTGKSYSDTAKELKIDRSTLYAWSIKINFQAYYNRLISDVRQDVINELHSFHLDAVRVIRDSLNSKNNAVKSRLLSGLLRSWKIGKLAIQTQEPGSRSFVQVMNLISDLIQLP